MGVINREGYLIEWPEPPLMGGLYQVSLSSKNPRLMQKLNQPNEQIKGKTLEEAIANAQARVDELLAA